MSFAERCGQDSPERQARCAQVLRLIESTGIEQIRLSWCDQHGQLRGKTLTTRAIQKALQDGIGMVSTILLKDTSDRTVYKIFEEGGVADLPGFEAAGNLVLLPDPASFRQLPWAANTGWLQCQAWFQNGEPVLLDTRRLLQNALQTLKQAGFSMQCGLEIEFHIYKVQDGGWNNTLDPDQAAWPGLPPAVQMIHPGYNLLSEAWSDLSALPLRIVQHTAEALGLPLTSLEIELGPSQVEAVFDVTDALTAADNMVLFRSGVTQALRRAGYFASFMCRPPFPNIMSSGWHLHQSLIDNTTGRNAFARERSHEGTAHRDALHTLSANGAHYLAGLLAHAAAMAALAVPTINGFERFRPNALAPQSIVWGRDNRGAMLRVVGVAGDAATHLENRIGEPAANPYLYIASQIYAGLNGIGRRLEAPPATVSPYSNEGAAAAANGPNADQIRLPATLGEALEALHSDPIYRVGFGALFLGYYQRVKQSEVDRYALADDKADWQKREYFSRI
jgi:glutamine synthetase